MPTHIGLQIHILHGARALHELRTACPGLDWNGLDWTGIQNWIGLDWIGLNWIGSDYVYHDPHDMYDRCSNYIGYKRNL